MDKFERRSDAPALVAWHQQHRHDGIIALFDRWLPDSPLGGLAWLHCFALFTSPASLPVKRI